MFKVPGSPKNDVDGVVSLLEVYTIVGFKPPVVVKKRVVVHLICITSEKIPVSVKNL